MDLISKLVDWLLTIGVVLLAPIVMLAGLVWLAASWGVVFNALGL